MMDVSVEGDPNLDRPMRSSGSDGLANLESTVNGRLLEEEEEFQTAFINEKIEEERKFKELFKDKSGKQFDPSSKFGVLEGEDRLLYDNITTSYKVNLPADYYHKAIQ
jgi:hypothetical protein